MREIKISREGLSKKQLFYLNCGEDEVLFGGARGGGKSHVNRIGAVEDCFKYPGRNVIFVRPTIKSARDQFNTQHMSSIIPREIVDEETGERITLWSFNAQDSVYTFHNGPDPSNPKDGGSRLILGGITTLQDAQDSYQGIEFISIWWDELTKAHYDAILYLKGSLRDKEHTPKFRAASNPGEKSHKDVKEAFVTPWQKTKKAILNNKKLREKFGIDESYNSKLSWKKTVRDEMSGEDLVTTYAYIPATLDDNPNENVRKNYLKTLSTLPEHLRKMYREGSWDTYEGKYWDKIDTSKNYVKLEKLRDYNINFEEELHTMKTYLSMDWGYSDYTAIYWHLETSVGTIVTYKELYVNGMTMDDVAAEVERINKEMKIKPTAIYVPHDIFISRGGQFKTNGGQVIGDTLADLWIYNCTVTPVKASNNRILGWQNMTKGLKDINEVRSIDEGSTKITNTPKWLILKEDCRELVKEIESAQVDPAKVDDILKGRKDHGIDSVRMLWVSHRIDPKIEEKVFGPQEGTGAWIRLQHQKKTEREARERRRQFGYYD